MTVMTFPEAIQSLDDQSVVIERFNPLQAFEEQTFGNRLFMLIGIPGCGKSTFAQKILPGTPRISSDDIRRELSQKHGLGQELPQNINDEVFGLFHERIGNHLRTGHCIADSTALKKFARSNLIETALRQNAEIHVIWFTNVKQAVERNAQRSGEERVPDEAMEKMVAAAAVTELQMPSERHYYDSVTIINDFSLPRMDKEKKHGCTIWDT